MGRHWGCLGTAARAVLIASATLLTVREMKLNDDALKDDAAYLNDHDRRLLQRVWWPLSVEIVALLCLAAVGFSTVLSRVWMNVALGLLALALSLAAGCAVGISSLDKDDAAGSDPALQLYLIVLLDAALLAAFVRRHGDAVVRRPPQSASPPGGLENELDKSFVSSTAVLGSLVAGGVGWCLAFDGSTGARSDCLLRGRSPADGGGSDSADEEEDCAPFFGSYVSLALEMCILIVVGMAYSLGTASHWSSGSAVLLALCVALSVREAQTYGELRTPHAHVRSGSVHAEVGFVMLAFVCFALMVTIGYDPSAGGSSPSSAGSATTWAGATRRGVRAALALGLVGAILDAVRAFHGAEALGSGGVKASDAMVFQCMPVLLLAVMLTFVVEGVAEGVKEEEWPTYYQRACCSIVVMVGYFGWARARKATHEIEASCEEEVVTAMGREQEEICQGLDGAHATLTVSLVFWLLVALVALGRCWKVWQTVTFGMVLIALLGSANEAKRFWEFALAMKYVSEARSGLLFLALSQLVLLILIGYYEEQFDGRLNRTETGSTEALLISDELQESNDTNESEVLNPSVETRLAVFRAMPVV